MNSAGLRFLNPAIIGIYMACLIALGLRFSRRQKTTDRYFIAGRSIPGWAMGVSLLATIITSVTFIAYPGAAYAGDWSLITPGIMILAIPVTIGVLVVPFFRKVVGMSAFEYFGQRFGSGVRMYCSATFAVGHLCKMSFVLYLLALTVNSITGWNSITVLLITTLVGVLYALIGGFEAVIWADVIQGALLWIGVFLAICYLLYLTPASPLQIFHAAVEAHKFSFGSPGLNLRQPTILVLLLYGAFFYLQKYTADQTVVQRYLVARNDGQALRGILLGAALCVPVWCLFMMAGTLLWGYYHFSHEALPGFISRGDQVFPFFLSTHLPPGVGGVFLAALFGAGMAMIASDLNCLATVYVKDFYLSWRPSATDHQSLSVGRVCVFASGIAAFSGAWALAQSQGTLLALYYAITSVVAGGLAGIFVLAFLSGRTTARAIHTAIAANLAFTIWATLTSGKHSWIPGTRYAFPWHEYTIGAIGQLLVIGIGLASNAFSKSAAREDAMTLWTWLSLKHQSRAALRIESAPQSQSEVPSYPTFIKSHGLEKQ